MSDMDQDSQMYEARAILDEDVRPHYETSEDVPHFLVDWADDPVTGPWPPSWEPEEACSEVLLSEWNSRKQSDPGIVGRYTKEKKKERALKQQQQKSSARSSKTPDSRRSNTASKRKRSQTIEDDSYRPKEPTPPVSSRSSRKKKVVYVEPGTETEHEVEAINDSPSPIARRSSNVIHSDPIEIDSSPIRSASRGQKPKTYSAFERRRHQQKQSKSKEFVDSEDEVPGSGSGPSELTDEDRQTSAANRSNRVQSNSKSLQRNQNQTGSRSMASDSTRGKGPIDVEIATKARPSKRSVQSNRATTTPSRPTNSKSPATTPALPKHVAFTQGSSGESVVAGTISTGISSQPAIKSTNDPVKSDQPLRSSSATHSLHEAMTERLKSSPIKKMAAGAQGQGNTVDQPTDQVMGTQDDGVDDLSATQAMKEAIALLCEDGYEDDQDDEDVTMDMEQGQEGKLDMEDNSGHRSTDPISSHQNNTARASDEDEPIEDSQSQQGFRSLKVASKTTVAQSHRDPGRAIETTGAAKSKAIETRPMQPIEHVGHEFFERNADIFASQNTVDEVESVPSPAPLAERTSKKSITAKSVNVPTHSDKASGPTDARGFQPLAFSTSNAAPSSKSAVAEKQSAQAAESMNLAASSVQEANARLQEMLKRLEKAQAESTRLESLTKRYTEEADKCQFDLDARLTEISTKELSLKSRENALDNGRIELERQESELIAREAKLSGQGAQGTSRVAELESELSNLRTTMSAQTEDVNFHRELYHELQDKGLELAMTNNSLQERVASLKSQVDSGLKQYKLFAQAQHAELQNENTQLKQQLAFLVSQNRATGDEIRKRAAQYPNLQNELLRLSGDVITQTKRASAAEAQLRRAKKENKSLRDRLIAVAVDEVSEGEYEEGGDIDPEDYPRIQDLARDGYTYTIEALASKGIKDPLAWPEPSALATESVDVQMKEPTDTPQASVGPALTANPDVASASAAVEPISVSLSGETTETQGPSPDTHDGGARLGDTLLKHLDDAFRSIALPFETTVNVVQSIPKKTSSLFPYSPTAYKTWERKILITVSGQVEAEKQAAESNPSPSLLICALEAYVFTIPATLTTVLYISKVDSSGYSPLSPEYKPPALTTHLLVSFLDYYMSPSTRPTPRVYCHLFARAQNQYLFPNSIEGGTKKTLSGLGLCKWWRSVFEKTVLTVDNARPGKQSDATMKSETYQLKCWLPGIEAAEAKGMMGVSSNQLPEGVAWSYDAPFTGKEATALYPDHVEFPKLSCVIPRFEDDPKARYLDEIVSMKSDQAHAAVKRAQKAAGTNSTEDSSSSAQQKQKRKAEVAQLRQEAAVSLNTVVISHYWETLGARQDCHPGDITGFLSLGVTGPVSGNELLPPQVNALDQRIGNMGGLDKRIVDRLIKALLNHDFGSRELALTASSRFLGEVENIISSEIGFDRWRKECTSSQAKNSEPERINPSRTKAAGSSVNVLMPVRKKKKNTPEHSSRSAPSAPTSGNMSVHPPASGYQCRWRLGDALETQCAALLATQEELEQHVINHILK